MFQFAGFASRPYGFRPGYPCGWVAPFGDPGITERSPLPPAFRSVPRPSSPLSAKASTRCPCHALDRYSTLSRACARTLARTHAPREDTLPPRRSCRADDASRTSIAASGPPRSRTHFLFTLSNSISRSRRNRTSPAGARPAANVGPSRSSVVAASAPNGHGGGERDRTDDLLLAKQALSQLSYTPRVRRQMTDDRHQKHP
jgi:hypothetical protein